MAVSSRVIGTLHLRNIIKSCVNANRCISTSPKILATAESLEENAVQKIEEGDAYQKLLLERQKDIDKTILESKKRIDELLNMRFIYPEFLPDPIPKYRNKTREKIERRDMLARRSNVEIPEFYVGSIVAVNYSDQHAPGKNNRFMGICIQRQGAGLKAHFTLRNVIDGEGVEIQFDLYDPTIQRIDVIRLEKRLDEELFYLRDAPPEYSTFPLDMEAEYHPEGAPVPVNDMKIPLKPTPWLVRWERMGMKGIRDVMSYVNEKRQRKARLKQFTRPWEKYDLLKIYRETIPVEEQTEIFAEVQSKLHELELHRRKMKRSRNFVKPKKTG